MSQSIQLRIMVAGNNQAEIMANTLALWQDFLDDPKAELPWQVDYVVSEQENRKLNDAKFVAEVLINATGGQG